MSRTLLAIWICTMSFALSAQAQPRINREYELKAAYLYQFKQHIPRQDRSRSDPFVIGVLGETPFGSYERNRLAQLRVRLQTVTLHQLRDSEVNVDVLFVPSKGARNSDNFEERLSSIADLGSNPSGVSNAVIVTDLDSRRIDSRVPHVNFWIDRGANRLKLDVYQDRLNDAGFDPTDQLMDLSNVTAIRRRRDAVATPPAVENARNS